MDNFKSWLDFIKSFGAAFALVMGAVIWIGKPYADDYIKDTTKTEIKVLKDSLQETNKAVKEMMLLLTIMADEKDIKELKNQRDAINTLKGN